MPFQSRSSTPLLLSLLFGILALIALHGPASAAPADPIVKSNIFGSLAALSPRDTTGVTAAWTGSNQGRQQRKHEDEDESSDAPKDESSDYKPELKAADFKDVPEKQKKTEAEPDDPKCAKHCYGTCCKEWEWCTPMAGRELPRYYQCCPLNYVADWNGKCCLQHMFDKGVNGLCFAVSPLVYPKPPSFLTFLISISNSNPSYTSLVFAAFLCISNIRTCLTWAPVTGFPGTLNRPTSHLTLQVLPS